MLKFHVHGYFVTWLPRQDYVLNRAHAHASYSYRCSFIKPRDIVEGSIDMESSSEHELSISYPEDDNREHN
jgi:hypothetical protein